MTTPLRKLASLIGLLLCLTACPSNAPGPSPDPTPPPDLLESFKGEHRVLVVFAAEDDPALETQRAEIKAHKTQWRGADLLLLEVVEGSPLRLAGQTMQVPPAAHVREALSAETGRFTAVLVGLDGEEKMRIHSPALVADLIAADPPAADPLAPTQAP